MAILDFCSTQFFVNFVEDHIMFYASYIMLRTSYIFGKYIYHICIPKYHLQGIQTCIIVINLLINTNLNLMKFSKTMHTIAIATKWVSEQFFTYMYIIATSYIPWDDDDVHFVS